jgi:hypothetical protein
MGIKLGTVEVEVVRAVYRIRLAPVLRVDGTHCIS